MTRMEQLHRLLERTPNDPFLLYGIALEHKKAGEGRAAIEWLDKTIATDAKYCYAYYQKGQCQESLNDFEGAATTYRTGIAAARQVGDAKAEGELSQALSIVE